MAGVRGNTAWVAAAKQSAKAAIPSQAAYKNPFSGGNVQPSREIDHLQETDSNRDQGVSYVRVSGVEGTPELYVRDDSIAFYLYAALGAVASSGTTNYTHTITPANNIPYITVWRNVGDLLFERFEDTFVTSLQIKADAGQPLTAQVGLAGRKPVRLTSDPSSGWTSPAVPLASGSVYSFNEAAITLGGGATSLISSFELNIDNNVNPQQTDDVIPYDIVAGTREVSLSFDLIFETIDEYAKFHYGGAAGTAVSSSIFTTSAAFDFSKGANNDVTFTLPSIAYEEFPVEPDPGGDPVVVSCRATAQRGASPVLTAVVKNQVASY